MLNELGHYALVLALGVSVVQALVPLVGARLADPRLMALGSSAAIAATHMEFILIHPFREGNGRISRVLADVMAVQAGRMPLDYSAWEADKPRYFAAIQRGLSRDYSEMTRLTMLALETGA